MWGEVITQGRIQLKSNSFIGSRQDYSYFNEFLVFFSLINQIDRKDCNRKDKQKRLHQASRQKLQIIKVYGVDGKILGRKHLHIHFPSKLTEQRQFS